MRDAASAKRQTSAAVVPLLPVLGLRTRLLFLLHVLCVVIAVTVSRHGREEHAFVVESTSRGSSDVLAVLGRI